ncbi:hypothetical protein Trco_007427 [Trichoderma cornu-damae]|uniref:Uncharacterized protein n=1 Tax=Trichoderma cornu-damae TaxID=654480 RepID=A0A9P8TRJ4_9HYPO|nr:hypothetical protein Trco_007427 [Trichoderma cornu-damae]
MGRPRAKKVASGDSVRRLSASTEPNEDAISKSTTPGAVVTDTETAVLIAETLAAEVETGKPLVPEPKQTEDSWMPLFDELGQLNETEANHESEHAEQPEEESMEFLSTI